MRLYHVTKTTTAGEILRDGFRDATGTYLTVGEHTGVWLSDRPTWEGGSADPLPAGWTCLQVDLDFSEGELAQFEWREEGKPYREFLVPAEVVNRRSKVSTGAIPSG